VAQYCRFCGSALDRADKFCSYCGTLVSDHEHTSTPPNTAEPSYGHHYEGPPDEESPVFRTTYEPSTRPTYARHRRQLHGSEFHHSGESLSYVALVLTTAGILILFCWIGFSVILPGFPLSLFSMFGEIMAGGFPFWLLVFPAIWIPLIPILSAKASKQRMEKKEELR